MTASVYSQSSNPLFKMVRICCLAFLMVVYSAPLWSFDFPENLQFHGFASQGYSLTSENNFFGHSQNDGSFDYTEIGANASWLPFNHLQLSGQLLFRRAGETDPGEIKLDYGLLDYTVLSTESDQLGMRLGRVKNPVGFYNETRDVAFTRPSILLPQSIYPDNLRSESLSSDSLFIYGEHRADYGDFFLQAGMGYPQAVDRELEGEIFGQRVPGTFDSDISYISRLLYEWNGGQLKIGFNLYQANWYYHSNINSTFPFPSDSLKITPWIFSLQYNAERWSLTSEYSLRKVHFYGITETAENYYFQGSYRFTNNWEALLRYDVVFDNKKDKNGKKFAATDPLHRPPYSRFAKDWTLGLNWNATSQLSLRAEYHRVEGTSWLPPLDNPDSDDTSRNWDLLLLLASYRF